MLPSVHLFLACNVIQLLYCVQPKHHSGKQADTSWMMKDIEICSLLQASEIRIKDYFSVVRLVLTYFLFILLVYTTLMVFLEFLSCNVCKDFFFTWFISSFCKVKLCLYGVKLLCLRKSVENRDIISGTYFKTLTHSKFCYAQIAQEW